MIICRFVPLFRLRIYGHEIKELPESCETMAEALKMPTGSRISEYAGWNFRTFLYRLRAVFGTQPKTPPRYKDDAGASAKGKPVTTPVRNASRPGGTAPSGKKPPQRSMVHVPKSFDVSQDEVIRKIKLRSGVYRRLTSQDLLKFDTTDDPRIEAEAPRHQQKRDHDVTDLKDETVKFNQALKLYEQGSFVSSFAMFERLAEQNSIPALFYKSIMLYDGMGTNSNPAVAVALMKKVYELAKKSLLDIELRHLACYHIGHAYNSGFGVRHDGAEAVVWWKKAAEEVLFNPDKSVENQTITDAGPLCQTCIGTFYSRDSEEETGPNWEKSFFWHSEAARNGSLESVTQLGLLQWYGLGCIRNDDLAHEYLLNAAEHGNYCAMGHLAVFYTEKLLYESAHMWIGKILSIVEENQNDVEAAVSRMTKPGTHNQDVDGIAKSVAMCFFVLGYLLETGKVMKRDRTLARSFYRKADQIDDDLVGFLGGRLRLGKSES
ncbi:putative LRP2-binding protein [Hypsibius exemplaris]|uniref:LRP2-binding protein n=1 Tax=Hypsibius exemplaris TaxID=2072580 RepID=A0A1W0WD79_HYPEX|nr:putative LRP2-binding protein [Hypsibius exemplaris]